MKLNGVYQLPAAPEKVFVAITDPEVLQKAIDGCEKMVKTGEDAYEAHMKLGLAGIKGSYVGKVFLREIKPPHSYSLVVEGKGAPGFVKATAKINLLPKNKGTELHCEADAQVGGMIAAIGSRLIEVAAKKLMADFFKKFAAQLPK